MIALSNNLQVANRAVKYTSSRMTLGASNKIGDVFGSFGGSMICIIAERGVYKESQDSTTYLRIIRLANIAEATGCGNCGEQAAIAFKYLDVNLIKPLDYMQLLNADHAFVVIGRDIKSDVKDYKSWGNNCVVCDPWYGRFFSASQIPELALGKKGFKATSVCRIN